MKTKFSAEVALLKAQNWCAYQERSQDETRRKLRSLGLPASEADEVIATLIEENYINEERFAIAFAGGKFRIKSWGRNKIKAELRTHKVSEYCINKALKSIDENDYRITLRRLIEKKRDTLATADKRKVHYSVLNYLVARGFESDLVSEQLLRLTNDND
ncbi:MAG: regulatory protein RecX [bacterium]|nr:regulatory protein RecX [bacterium]